MINNNFLKRLNPFKFQKKAEFGLKNLQKCTFL